MYERMFAEYNQQDATSHNLFISVKRCTCFRRFFRPSSGLKTAHTASGICQTKLAAGSNIGLTNAWRYMCSFELLMMDVKIV